MEEVEFKIDILRGQKALFSLNGKHVPIFGQGPNDNINWWAFQWLPSCLDHEHYTCMVCG
jgi:hypothetical protein